MSNKDFLLQYQKEFETKMKQVPPGIYGAAQNVLNDFVMEKMAGLEARIVKLEEEKQNGEK